MEIIRETIKIKDESIISLLCSDDIFLDIETLGLSPEKHNIYMIGIARVLPGKASAGMTLFFAHRSGEEKELLLAFLEELPKEGRLITYNGDRFDLPFIKKRSEINGIDISFEKYTSLDILKHVRPLKSLLMLPGCSQKEVEGFLGIKREDKFSGRELIKVYKDYELCPDEASRLLLLQHNRDDVAGLINIMQILSYEKIRSMEIALTETDFSGERELLVKGRVSSSLPRPVKFSGRGYYIMIDGNSLRVVFMLKDGCLRYEYTDCENYVYLPGEDMAVPKALASSIPKEHKEKATPDNCHSYVPCKKETLTDAALSGYISSLLKKHLLN